MRTGKQTATAVASACRRIKLMHESIETFIKVGMIDRKTWKQKKDQAIRQICDEHELSTEHVLRVCGRSNSSNITNLKRGL